MCLEFSKIDNEVLNFFYKQYSRAIPLIGKYVAGASQPYDYLIKSIDQFYTQQQLIESQRERNNIMNGPFSGDRKRELTDTLIKLENELLKITIDYLADMDIEFIFDKTFGLKSLVLGTAENAVKSNPREKKN